MTTAVRSRSRIVKIPQLAGKRKRFSTFYWAGSPISTNVQLTNLATMPDGREDCVDRITLSPPREPNYLELTKVYGKRGSIHGSYTTPAVPPTSGYQYTYVFDGWSTSRLASPINTGLLSQAYEDPNDWLAAFLANASLSTPIFDLTNFIWELKELPKLLKYTGDLLSGRKPVHPGDLWLAQSFGWQPLISDLKSMLNFAEAVEKRLDELMDAKREERVRRKLHNSVELYHPTIPDLEGITFALVDAHTTKVWGTGRWRVQDHAGLEYLRGAVQGSRGNLAYAIRALGLPSSSGIWNSIPWSWLIDYFWNIGDILETHGKEFPVHLKDVSIMVYQKAEEQSQVLWNLNNLQYRPHRFVRERKARRGYTDPNPILPSFRPILTWKQWSNLVALATGAKLLAHKGP